MPEDSNGPDSNVGAVHHLLDRIGALATPQASEAFGGLDLLTVQQVALLLNVTPRFVYDQYRSGALDGIKLNRRNLRFERRAVTAFVDARRRDTSQAR